MSGSSWEGVLRGGGRDLRWAGQKRGRLSKECLERDRMKGGGAVRGLWDGKGQVGGAQGVSWEGRSPDSAPPQALAGQQPPPSDLHAGLWLPTGAAGGRAGALGGGVLPAPRAGELALRDWKCCSRSVCRGLSACWADRGGVPPSWGPGPTGWGGLENEPHDPGQSKTGKCCDRESCPSFG